MTKSNFLLLGLLVAAVMLIVRLVEQLSLSQSENQILKYELKQQQTTNNNGHRFDPNIPLRDVYEGYDVTAN